MRDKKVNTSVLLMKWIEKWFFKRRIMFSCDLGKHPMMNLPRFPWDIRVITESEVEPEVYDVLRTRLQPGQIQERLQDPDLTLYVACDPQTGQVSGYVWTLHPSLKEHWQDSLCIKPGEVYAFNAYTRQEFRGKRVFHALMWGLYDDLRDSLGYTHVIAVIENQNKISLKANLDTGLHPTGMNYLIKFMGKNILSIVTQKSSIEIFWVASREHSHRL